MSISFSSLLVGADAMREALFESVSKLDVFEMRNEREVSVGVI